jgi:hypothetical protein
MAPYINISMIAAIARSMYVCACMHVIVRVHILQETAQSHRMVLPVGYCDACEPQNFVS